MQKREWRRVLGLGVLALVVSFWLVGLAGKAEAADNCTTQKPGFSCQDINKLANPNSCVTGLCPGGNNIRCCPANAAKATNAAGGVQGGAITFGNPIAPSSIEGFLTSILSTLQRIIVVLALVMIVIGAMMYLFSMGDTKKVENAKSAITSAMVGLAIAITAPSFLKEIMLVLGLTPADETVNSALSLTQIAMRVLDFLLSIFGVLALIVMIWGAMQYLGSGGDEKRMTKGKDTFKWALIGVIIAMSALIIVRQIAEILAAR